MLHGVPGARAADIRLGLRDGWYGSPDCQVHTLNFVPTALPVVAGQEDDTGGHGYDTDSDPDDDTRAKMLSISGLRSVNLWRLLWWLASPCSIKR